MNELTIGHNGPDHQALVDTGRAMIEWVAQHSPVMNQRVRKTVSDGTLKGARIAVVVHLEAKTAYLASILADAGAEVIVAGSNPYTTNAAVVAALRDKGIKVVSEANSDVEAWEQELLLAADHEPEYIIDDGAELTMRMKMHRPHLYERLKGISEETTTGTARLFALEAANQLPFPALTANNARCKHLFDNRYGTGQTTIQAILKLTNKQIAASQLVVVGYGYVGRGIAEYAKALKANVKIIEIDPVRALEAHMDGHIVGPSKDVLPNADFVITATGGIRALGQEEFNHLSHNVILANAGHHDLEIDVQRLSTLAKKQFNSRDSITTYSLEQGDVHVLSGGALVNIAGGSGHPVEIMDLTFAVQGLGAHYLVNSPLDSGVHVLPREIDDSIAQAKLESMGIYIDSLRPDQNDDFIDLINEAPSV